MKAGDTKFFIDGQKVTVLEVYAMCALVESTTGAKFTAENTELRDAIEQVKKPAKAPSANPMDWPVITGGDMGHTLMKIEMPYSARRQAREAAAAA